MTQSGHRFAYEHAGAQRFKTAGSALKRRLAGQAARAAALSLFIFLLAGKGARDRFDNH